MSLSYHKKGCGANGTIWTARKNPVVGIYGTTERFSNCLVTALPDRQVYIPGLYHCNTRMVILIWHQSYFWLIWKREATLASDLRENLHTLVVPTSHAIHITWTVRESSRHDKNMTGIMTHLIGFKTILETKLRDVGFIWCIATFLLEF